MIKEELYLNQESRSYVKTFVYHGSSLGMRFDNIT